MWKGFAFPRVGSTSGDGTAFILSTASTTCTSTCLLCLLTLHLRFASRRRAGAATSGAAAGWTLRTRGLRFRCLGPRVHATSAGTAGVAA